MTGQGKTDGREEEAPFYWQPPMVMRSLAVAYLPIGAEWLRAGMAVWLRAAIE